MVGATLALAAVFIVDRVGRVALLVYSCLASAVFLIIETALIAQIENGNTSTTLQSGAVAIQFLWYLGYAFGEPVQFLYIGEVRLDILPFYPWSDLMHCDIDFSYCR